jgi:hypothetical protein
MVWDVSAWRQLPWCFMSLIAQASLGAVPPKTSCIIFPMMLHPKPSQRGELSVFYSGSCLCFIGKKNKNVW